MGKFDGILICSDLDGTLYKNDKTISKENKDAIEYFKREGGYFTFITGRMPYYSLEAFKAVNPNAPFGCINGGGLYDGTKGEYVWTQSVAEGVADLIASVEASFSTVGIQVCTFDKTYFSKENAATVRFRDRTGVPYIPCHYREVTEPIAKILFCSDSENELCDIEKMLRAHPRAEEFGFIRSQRDLLEILPRDIDKGVSIFKLSEHLGLDVKRTIGVGDFNNDIPMFLAAGIGIAVSNACKDALAAADLITVSNEENAIAKIIQDLDRGIIVC